MKVMRPSQSKPPAFAEAGALDTGVSRTRNRARTDRAIEIQKIERQPRGEVAMRPPNRAQKPEPPQEPIDQKDSARWRFLPS